MYKVAYAKINNAGDLFNEYLLDYFKVDYKCTNVFDANLTMLGGMLSALLPSDKLKLRLLQETMCVLKNTEVPMHVWGTGFLVGSRTGKFMRPNLIVHALRGDLSRQKLEGILDRKLDVILCDPGLLAREFVSPSEKKYSVGIIPHYKEQDNRLLNDLQHSYSDSILIDITKPCDEVLKEISECETILSSSLHGLIFADSLNIPNMHVIATNKLAGDGFKFRDYYSSYGLEHAPYYLSEGNVPNLNDVKKQYRISKNETDEKIEKMIEAFPREL